MGRDPLCVEGYISLKKYQTAATISQALVESRVI